MRLSTNWLRSIVGYTCTNKKLVDLLSIRGHEAFIDEQQLNFSNVVVAKVIGLEQHPNADKLKVCQISDGNSNFQVICGAKNVRENLTVAFAKKGAILPNNFKIKATKLRGIKSEGMLCSAKELDISGNLSGIMELDDDLQLGEKLENALNLVDEIIEFEITPNRGDCLSVNGIARDISAILDLNNQDNYKVDYKVDFSKIKQVNNLVKMATDNYKLSPCYLAMVIDNIQHNSTPDFIRKYLISSDIAVSNNIIIDIVNYVMLETGQPMHAFDFNKIKGTIKVNKSNGQQLKLLNNNDIKLDNSTIVIEDEEKVIAIAGIIGSYNSMIESTSSKIVLEAAVFNQSMVALSSRKLGINTDASYRFARGVDISSIEKAVSRVLNLLVEYSDAKAISYQKIINSDCLITKKIKLDYQKVSKVLGKKIEKQKIIDILLRLNCQIISNQEDKLLVEIPLYRNDLNIEEDLIEEILRLFGPENIPLSKPLISSSIKNLFDIDILEIQKFLKINQFKQVINYSFIDEKLYKLTDDLDYAIELQNPLSEEMKYMRSSLLGCLLKTLSINVKQNKVTNNILFFEDSLVFKKTENGIEQKPKIAGIILNSQYKNWQGVDDFDFYSLKQLINNLFLTCDLENPKFDFINKDSNNFNFFDKDKSLIVLQEAGVFGEINKKILKDLDLINYQVLAFELDVTFLLKNPVKKTVYQEFSKFPGISRDLSLVVDSSITYDKLKALIEKTDRSLKNLDVVDIYHDKKLKNKKIISIRLFWQDIERTLKDKEINKRIENILKILVENQIKLR